MYVSPIFGITGPDNQTDFNKLGTELKTMLQSIDSVLANLDYNGADPELVAARVAALEAWRTTATARIAALEAAQPIDTGWVPITPATGFSVAGAAVRRRGNTVIYKGSVTKGSPLAQASVGDLAFVLPDARFRSIEDGRIATAGFGSPTANSTNVVVSKSSLEIRGFATGPLQNTIYLAGVTYQAA